MERVGFYITILDVYDNNKLQLYNTFHTGKCWTETSFFFYNYILDVSGQTSFFCSETTHAEHNMDHKLKLKLLLKREQSSWIIQGLSLTFIGILLSCVCVLSGFEWFFFFCLKGLYCGTVCGTGPGYVHEINHLFSDTSFSFNFVRKVAPIQ